MQVTSQTFNRERQQYWQQEDNFRSCGSISIDDLPPQRPVRQPTTTSFSSLINSVKFDGIDDYFTPQKLTSQDIDVTVFASNDLLTLEDHIVLNESAPKEYSNLITRCDQSKEIIQQSIVKDLVAINKSIHSIDPVQLRLRSAYNSSSHDNLSSIHIINEKSSCFSSCTFDISAFEYGYDESIMDFGAKNGNPIESRFLAFSSEGTNGIPTTTTTGCLENKRPTLPRRRSTLSTAVSDNET